MTEALERFYILMDSAEVREAAQSVFGGTDFQYRFIVMTARCLTAIPQTDMADGVCTDGACVFYVPTTDRYDGTNVPVYEPWSFQVDLGSCANYRFEKIGDYTHSHNACDSEEFHPDLLAMLERSLWLPVRHPMSSWA